ncbi:septum formation protein [Filimonas lacunae]|uniref:dTTP/UTP pyrophosphatase n=1 Tax=Filimonas lacunae TaxID=477680 RepID=A0A173ME85_9BACT|nr:Maf family nucleotide pyrophosphatase [Filimonas lacunae]BAV05748.1 septum formation protein Maf [Filimonas lacunae]SIT28727.1 septum formation protein [Filimonas lacunae]
MQQQVILASQSPRRKQLLEWAEVPFTIVVKETAETYPESMAIAEVPVHIARQKALAVREQLQSEKPAVDSPVILAADTVVVLGKRIIGKPKSRQDAIDTLTDLAGQRHDVITGVVILHQEKEISFYDVTHVEFHYLSADEIAFYVDKYKPYDKAGAYAIQEWIGVVGIKSIEGDFYNVMGLPVSRVVRALKDLSVL